MKAFYGSRFSPNMTRTPEGFLICHNVPIARTGWQEYLGQELQLNDFYNQVIPVFRSPEEVFHATTMASFEGKPVTDEHPPELIKPENADSYNKGHTQNVRRGTGEESDLLLADLFITNPNLISEIEAGKREVSCGYDCLYEPLEEGKYQQVQIRGNHVAVVEAGRAGSRVAIKDNKPNLERSKGKMKTTDKKGILSKMLSVFVKDAEPDEIAQAIDAVCGAKDEEITPPGQDPKPNDQNGQIFEMLKGIAGRLEALEKKETVPAKDALEELESELSSSKPETIDAEGEESVTVPAEEITDESGDGPNYDPEKKPVQNADRKAMLQAIKEIKPAVAAIKDAGDRKKVSDALAASLRNSFGVTTPAPAGGYGQIMKAVQANARKKATDSAPKDNSDFGKKCAERNPHLKGGK